MLQADGGVRKPASRSDSRKTLTTGRPIKSSTVYPSCSAPKGFTDTSKGPTRYAREPAFPQFC